MRRLQGKLIVSCQADQGDAFFGQMDGFAKAAAAGGAGGIRANGVPDVRAIRNAINLPIIGIQKTYHDDGKILITPSFEAARGLVEAGADMIALDCTQRGQRYGALDRLQRIKAGLHVPVLADIATVEEARDAARAGADAILSTMRGYTDDTAHITQFDPRFVAELVDATKLPVLAEGRVDTPDLARQAIAAGAFAVVVGTAITRPHVVTKMFADAVHAQIAAQAERWILGLDMGGTNTKIGLVSSRGQLLWDETIATPARAGRATLLQHLQDAALRGLERARQTGCDPHAIGIATAGWVDSRTGHVVYATENLPGWTGTRIAEIIAQATGKPVFVENDANALAVGEKRFGAARHFEDFVCITLGTGVGGGCFIGGRLNRGAHFFANAFGHICIESGGKACSCGQQGCLEAYTSVAALLEYAHHRYADAVELIEAANRGDAAATAAIYHFAQRLAVGCSIMVQLLDPEALIIAGGIAQNNPLLLITLREELAKLVPVWEQRDLKMINSSLGYHAGVLGAAALAL